MHGELEPERVPGHALDRRDHESPEQRPLEEPQRDDENERDCQRDEDAPAPRSNAPARFFPFARLRHQIAHDTRKGAGNEAAPSDLSDEEALLRWFEQDSDAPVPQAGHGELHFLADYPDTGLLHSRNTLTIDAASLDSGWVGLRQCYDGLDAVPDAQIVYRYKDMRKLRIESHSGIGSATVQGNSIQMRDTAAGATLCVRAQTRILQADDAHGFVLRNGPFHRRFLDGYFPFHVTLEIHYPASG